MDPQVFPLQYVVCFGDVSDFLIMIFLCGGGGQGRRRLRRWSGGLGLIETGGVIRGVGVGGERGRGCKSILLLGLPDCPAFRSAHPHC